MSYLGPNPETLSAGENHTLNAHAISYTDETLTPKEGLRTYKGA